MSIKTTMFLIFISLFLIKADSVSASNLVVSSSASLKRYSVEETNDFDLRIFKLQNYLKKQGSPMELYAAKIINIADKYNLDWRLIISIAGVESSFGKRMPKNTFNAYGWANGKYNFASWEESFEVVSKTLKDKYINKGSNSLESIARIYAPPSKTWARNVNYFINQIDPTPIVFEN